MRKSRSVSYHKNLIKDLRNPGLAAEYLNAAIEHGDAEGFLMALRHVLEALGTMTHASRKTKIKRLSLHKMLSKEGNPRAKNLITIFNYIGLKFKFENRKSFKKVA